MKKRFYIIEPLDINGDKNPDGFLVSQYRIDKNGNKIFLKNRYITFELLKKIRAKKMRTGGNYKKPNIQHPQNFQIYNNDKEFNQFMNNKQYQQQHQLYNSYSKSGYHHPQHPYHPQHPQHQYHHQQYPPQYVVHNKSGFTENVQSGLGLGIGFAIGDGLVDAAFDFIGF